MKTNKLFRALNLSIVEGYNELTEKQKEIFDSSLI